MEELDEGKMRSKQRNVSLTVIIAVYFKGWLYLSSERGGSSTQFNPDLTLFCRSADLAVTYQAAQAYIHRNTECRHVMNLYVSLKGDISNNERDRFNSLSD